jgi:hypothetical protein
MTFAHHLRLTFEGLFSRGQGVVLGPPLIHVPYAYLDRSLSMTTDTRTSHGVSSYRGCLHSRVLTRWNRKCVYTWSSSSTSIPRRCMIFELVSGKILLDSNPIFPRFHRSHSRYHCPKMCRSSQVSPSSHIPSRHCAMFKLTSRKISPHSIPIRPWSHREHSGYHCQKVRRSSQVSPSPNSPQRCAIFKLTSCTPGTIAQRRVDHPKPVHPSTSTGAVDSPKLKHSKSVHPHVPPSLPDRASLGALCLLSQSRFLTFITPFPPVKVVVMGRANHPTVH